MPLQPNSFHSTEQKEPESRLLPKPPHLFTKPHACRICGKAYRFPSLLLRHEAIHGNQSDRKAKLAVKTLKKSAIRNKVPVRQKHIIELQQRMTQAGGAGAIRSIAPARPRNHRCAFCVNAFADSYKLERHMLSHTGEKPYVCPEPNCPHRTTQKYKVRVHVESAHRTKHHNACMFCSASFSRSAWLKVHLAGHQEFQAQSNKEKQETHGSHRRYLPTFHAGQLSSSSLQEVELPMLTKRKLHVSANKVLQTSLKRWRRVPVANGALMTLSSQYMKGSICICPKCGFAVPNKTIVAHRRFHEGRGTHSCTLCRVSYMNRSFMRGHEKTRLHQMRLVSEHRGQASNQGSGSPTNVAKKELDLNCSAAGALRSSRLVQLKTEVRQVLMERELAHRTRESDSVGGRPCDGSPRRDLMHSSGRSDKEQLLKLECPTPSHSAQKQNYEQNSCEKEVDSRSWVPESASRVSWSYDQKHLVATQFCGGLRICGVRYNQRK